MSRRAAFGRKRAVGVLVGLIAFAGAVGGEEVEPLRLFDPGPQVRSSEPASFAATSAALFFTAENDGVGRELWVLGSDEEAPRLLRDLEPGADGRYFPPADYSPLVVSGDRIFFSYFGRAICETWTSDGTVGGTTPLPERCGLVAELADERVLIASRARGGGLAVSDGSVAGTRALGAGPAGPGVRIERAAAAGGMAFLFARGASGLPGDRLELWVSDGTEAGTFLLTDFGGEPDLEPDGVLASGDRLFFFLRRGLRQEALWVSDGTPSGTFEVRAFDDPSVVELRLMASGPTGFGLLFGLLDTDGACSLWRSDGTAPGTRVLVDFEQPVDATVCPREVVETGSGIFFSVRAVGPDLDETQLWVTDGAAAAQTRKLREWRGIGHLLASLTAFDGELAFRAREGRAAVSDPRNEAELWRSDGTVAGTRPIFEFEGIEACDRASPRMQAFGGKLYFCGADSVHGKELWESDGTTAGTRRLANLAPDIEPISFDHVVDASSASVPLLKPVVHGDRIVFLTASRAGAQRLWALAADPWRLELLLDGAAVPDGADFAAVASTSEKLFFVTYPADTGETRLWVSDGTAAGTSELASAPADLQSLVALGPRACFFGADADGRNPELWCSDGTEEGTRPVGDFFAPSTVTLGHLTRLGSRLLFSARTGPGETEVWVSNGRAAGTRLVGHGSRSLVRAGELPLTVVGTDAFFIGNPPDGATDPTVLWVWRISSDPLRVEPAVALRSVEPSGGYWAAEGTAFRGRFVFVLDDQVRLRLFSSDGTPAGTRELVGFESTRQSRIHRLTPVGNDLYFVASTPETGEELWATDGTPEGTRWVKDIAPGLESSLPTGLTAAGSVLLFTASDGVHGFEPWRSDGTSEGTRRVADVEPGPQSSTPSWYVPLGEHIIFDGWTQDGGRDLWALDRVEVGSRACAPRPGRFCLGDERFEVIADWRDPRTGAVGRAEGRAYSDDTGQLWFFDERNLELLVKILDGEVINGHAWTFYGSLTDLAFWLSAADLETGVAKTYVQRARETCGGSDVRAFPLVEAPGTRMSESSATAGDRPVAPTAGTGGLQTFGSPMATMARPSGVGAGSSRPRPGVGRAAATEETGTCVADATTLCLLDGRFALSLDWRDQRRPGREGQGRAVPGTDRTGFFWFFRDGNLELMVKALDGRPVNGRFWIFYGSLTDVEFDLTVTDTVTGAAKTYRNPPGELCGRTDTAAFEP